MIVQRRRAASLVFILAAVVGTLLVALQHSGQPADGADGPTLVVHVDTRVAGAEGQVERRSRTPARVLDPHPVAGLDLRIPLPANATRRAELLARLQHTLNVTNDSSIAPTSTTTTSTTTTTTTTTTKATTTTTTTTKPTTTTTSSSATSTSSSSSSPSSLFLEYAIELRANATFLSTAAGEVHDVPFEDFESLQQAPRAVRERPQQPFGRITVQASQRAQPPRPMLVAITHCCTGNAELTRRLLANLDSLEDRIDVVVVSDGVVDGSAQSFENWGIRVLRTGAAAKPVGLSKTWNVAWRYFLNHTQYDTLFISNNDLLVAGGTFERLRQVLYAWDDRVRPIVLSPSTTVQGLGALSAPFLPAQNIERRIYSATPEFSSLRQRMPGSLCALNRLVRSFHGPGKLPVAVSNSASTLAFMPAFKRDPRLEHHPGALVAQGLWNFGQEENMYQRAQAVVAQGR